MQRQLTLRRYLLTGLGMSVGLSGVIIATDPEKKREARGYVSAFSRIANLVGTAASIAYDYKFCSEGQLRTQAHAKIAELEKAFDVAQLKQEQLVVQFHQLESAKESTKDVSLLLTQNRAVMDQVTEQLANIEEEANIQMSLVHIRNAKKMTQMCLQNEGIYIKLGQHLAMLDYIIPVEYQQELTRLLANNLQSSWEDVKSVLADDIGQAKLDSFFKSIESKPIASASLAQVHVAYGFDGKKYAVKVQHKNLREDSEFDRKAVTFIVDALSKVFPEFQFNWLTREMNKNLPLELDFQLEIANAKNCKNLLTHLVANDSVRVPESVDELCSSRVLTMSFEQGCYVTDKEGLKKAGLNPADVARLVSSIFSEQMFRHGFVHCDPHEANLLVRPHPKNPKLPQVVLLDHGLYRSLEPEFRKHYTRLWAGIVLGDIKAIKDNCTAMGAKDLYPLLAAILTKKPWDDIISAETDRLHAKGSKSENTLLRIYAAKYIKEINQLLGMVPSDMLLLLKTNDCLRHLDAQLGTPINTTIVMTETISDVILKEDMSQWWQRWLVDKVVGADWTIHVGGKTVYLHYNDVPQMSSELCSIVTTYSSIVTRVVGLSALSTYIKALGSFWNFWSS